MQRMTSSLEQCTLQRVIEHQLTQEQIVTTISTLLLRHSTKISVLSLNNNLLYSWRDAYYSSNKPHIDHVIQVFNRIYQEVFLLDHLIDILIAEMHSLHTYNYAILWLNTDLTTLGIRLPWRSSIVNWLIGIQRKNSMKSEVAQHAVRLIDAFDTLQDRNERLYQLRAMSFFILSAKFHNRSRIRMEEFSRYSANAFEPREISDSVGAVYHEINFEVQLPLVLDFIQLHLELNSNENSQLNTSKIRSLALLFIHIACIQSWSNCFNPSLLASSVLVLCLNFLCERNCIVQLCSIVSLFDHSIELILGLAGYIALICGDMPDIPTNRSNHYFYTHKMYNDEFRLKPDDNFRFDRVKRFCRKFTRIPDVNRQISYGMRNLVFNQIDILERTYPYDSNLSSYMTVNGHRPHDKCRPIQYTIRAILAAQRFARCIFERRKLSQQ